MDLQEKIDYISKVMGELKKLSKQLRSVGHDDTVVIDEWNKQYHERCILQRQQSQAIANDHLGFPTYEGFEMNKPKPKYGCECGAHHTSFPDLHSDWCPLYRRIR